LLVPLLGTRARNGLINMVNVHVHVCGLNSLWGLDSATLRGNGTSAAWRERKRPRSLEAARDA
jgi:hypothetical protein